KAVRDGAWFREELYARFAIVGDSGTWNGQSPLKRLETAA
ncbi:MAG: spheroidene monooxygenase, partial [Pseudomonadota bacterium]